MSIDKGRVALVGDSSLIAHRSSLIPDALLLHRKLLEVDLSDRHLGNAIGGSGQELALQPLQPLLAVDLVETLLRHHADYRVLKHRLVRLELLVRYLLLDPKGEGELGIPQGRAVG